MSTRRLRASTNGAAFEIDVETDRVRVRAESGDANGAAPATTAAAAATVGAMTTFHVSPVDPDSVDAVRVVPDDTDASDTAAGAAADADATPMRAHVVVNGDTTWVFIDGETFTIDIEPADQPDAAATRARRRAGGNEALSAPMPATVIKVLAEPGSEVHRGDMLLLLEAMKMELPVRAPRDGRVKALHCRAGELVQAGTVLVDLE